MSSLPIIDKNHWHQVRSKHVGASEVAALFGLSPYLTRYELWHQKAGNVVAGDFGDERITWGNRLEAAIAEGVAEDLGLTIRKTKRYIAHKSVNGMGCSLDYEILKDPRGIGCLEIKNVDALRFKQGWQQDDGDDSIPLHIQLQLQHQMACTGYQWGMIGALVGGNTLKHYTMPRHEATIGKLEKAVEAFWASIADGVEPKLDTDDLKLATELFNVTGVIRVDDPALDNLVSEYKTYGEAKKLAQEGQDHCKIKMLEIMSQLTPEEESPDLTVKTENHWIKFKSIEVAERTQTVPASSYKRFYFSKPKKEKKA